jgi:alpha-ketoglutarate-dependent taurine dioxygenase
MYAPIVGQPIGDSEGQSIEKLKHPSYSEFKWLEPYSGFPGAQAPKKENLTLFKNKEISDQFEHRDYSKVMEDDSANLEMMQALLRHGVVILDQVPKIRDSQIVRGFADKCLGGMQKDPAREEPNWVITRKDSALSVSYAQTLRLNNHTDQSIPAHGIPALCLCVHYVEGQGVNTLVDAYAVAEAIKERDPEAFSMLSTYGNSQERDFVRSRVDSMQKGTQGMLISTKQPILQLDDDGHVIRAQYNEVFRTPSTLPFDKFEAWYRAYSLWVELIHSPEFEVEVPICEGQLLVLDNWRVLHGRAGGKSSPNRTIMGGTVVREAFVSRAMQLLGANYPVLDGAAAR